MLIDAGTVLKVVGGAVAAVGGKKLYDVYFGGEDLDDTMEALYLEKGPGGLVRWLKREGHAEDLDEAREMVADFEDDNDDIMKKYARKVARREERETQREEREASRKARTSRRTQSATA